MLTPKEEEAAAEIMESMLSIFRNGSKRINSNFALHSMALTLAGIVHKGGASRNEFCHVMTNAWDGYSASLSKMEKKS